jgi:hypothetical protein
VDDARTLRHIAARRPAEEPVDERAGGVPRRRVDDNPRRLVDDQQVLVLVGNLERDLLRRELRLRRLRLERDLLAPGQPVALRPALSVDKRPLLEQALGGRSGADVRKRGEEAV